MGTIKTSFVAKKYNNDMKQIILYANFGYKVFDVLKNKSSYKPLRYYTGIKVENKEWDSIAKLPLNNKKRTELQNIERTLKDIYNYLIRDNAEITPNILKNELDQKIKGKTKTEQIISIVDYIEKVILVAKNGRSAITLKNYTKLSNKIKAFEEEQNVKFTIQNLNEELYLAYVEFLKKKLGKINSVWGEIKNLKAVLNDISRKYKITVFNPTTQLAKKDKISSRSEEKIYLNFEHITKILKHKPKNESLANTKLILTCLLFTGCRYSDVFKIKPDHVYEKNGIRFNYARFIDQKTGKDIIVPFLKPLEQAFKENNNQPPYQISSQKFNEYVKDLAEQSGLTDDVTLSFTNSYGKKQYEIKPFYKFVSSHIGRRSFITNLINYVPVTILSKITGHSLTNKNVIFSYNQISLLDNAVLFVKELERVEKKNPKDLFIGLV